MENFNLNSLAGSAVQGASAVPAFGLSYLMKDYLERVNRKYVSKGEDKMSVEDMVKALQSEPSLEKSKIDLNIEPSEKFVGHYSPKNRHGNHEIAVGKNYQNPSVFYHEQGHLLNEHTPGLKQIQQLGRITRGVPYRLGANVAGSMLNQNETDPIRGAGKAIGMDLLSQSPTLMSEAAASIRALSRMKGNQRMRAIPALASSFLGYTAPSVVGSGILGASQALANKHVRGMGQDPV